MACGSVVLRWPTTWAWSIRWRLAAGAGLPRGKKVLIVLDQFEQWLHAKQDEQNTELVQALRQCDGEQVQCSRDGAG